MGIVVSDSASRAAAAVLLDSLPVHNISPDTLQLVAQEAVRAALPFLTDAGLPLDDPNADDWRTAREIRCEALKWAQATPARSADSDLTKALIARAARIESYLRGEPT